MQYFHIYEFLSLLKISTSKTQAKNLINIPKDHGIFVRVDFTLKSLYKFRYKRSHSSSTSALARINIQASFPLLSLTPPVSLPYTRQIFSYCVCNDNEIQYRLLSVTHNKPSKMPIFLFLWLRLPICTKCGCVSRIEYM